MITLFEFFMLLGTKAMVKVIYSDSAGKRYTIQGISFKVFNTCMDLKIELRMLDKIEVRNGTMCLFVSNKAIEIKEE